MRIQVQPEFAGSLRFRLTTPDGKREYVRGEKWTRKLASEALDLYQYVYKFKRKNIRFVHH